MKRLIDAEVVKEALHENFPTLYMVETLGSFIDGLPATNMDEQNVRFLVKDDGTWEQICTAPKSSIIKGGALDKLYDCLRELLGNTSKNLDPINTTLRRSFAWKIVRELRDLKTEDLIKEMREKDDKVRDPEQ